MSARDGRRVRPRKGADVEWELDPAVAHLNHGSFGAVPRAILAQQRRWNAAAERNPTGFHWRTLPREMDAVRAAVAAFVGTDPGRCVLLPNVTAGIGLVLASVVLAHGDEVIVTEDTYPGVRAAAQMACARAGATLVTARMAADDLSGAAVERAVLGCVSERTRLALIDHITSPTAILVNVAALTSALQARGVCVAVDGAHAPGSIPLDMDSIGADFYTGNFHKWCCAPRGAGFLAVGSGRVDDLVPGVVGSRADEGFPTGFEWSGARDYSAILSVPAALRLFQELGWSDVQARNRAMVTRGGELLRAALHAEHAPGAELPMAVVPLPGSADPQAVRRLREEMAARGIEVAMGVCRGRGHVRLSCHLYNHLKDFERLARALEEVVPGFLGNPGAPMG